MKLIYLLQRKSWFIRHDEKWSPLQDHTAVELALRVLPLTCVDEFDLPEQPLQHGRAMIEASDEATVLVRIVAADGSTTHEEVIALDANCLSSVDWVQPPEKDGWVRSEVALDADNVRRLTLKAYLPPVDGSDGKSLQVRNETTGQEKTLFMRRGEENELVLLDESEAGTHRLAIRCDAEAANDSADVRSLGFVLLDKVAGI